MPLHLRLLLPALILALGTGLGFIQPVGLLLGGVFVIVLLAGRSHLPSWLWLPLILLGAIALAAHLLPGFSPWQLWQPRLISADAAPYGLRLSWDKLLLGSALLAWWLGQPRRPVLSLKNAWLTCIATLLLVLLLAVGLLVGKLTGKDGKDAKTKGKKKGKGQADGEDETSAADDDTPALAADATGADPAGSVMAGSENGVPLEDLSRQVELARRLAAQQPERAVEALQRMLQAPDPREAQAGAA